MMEWRSNAAGGHLHEFLLANPLSKNLAEVWRNAMAATRDIQVALFQDGHAMSGLAENVRYGETANSCKAR